MHLWLLEQSVFSQMERAAAAFQPTAEMVAQFEARTGGDGPRGFSISGGAAEISIAGVLTKKPDLFAYFFGGGNTTYRDVIAGIDRALADSSVSQINLMIDSPGGSIDGLFDTIAALQSAKGKKQINAVVDGLAASAAYAIAAQADKITVKNYGGRVGSIGILSQRYVSDYVVSLTSTEAPKKAPDVRTDEGRAMIIEELDALHALFAESIATGRGVTVEKVNAEYGRGGVFLAGEALKRGMIDAVAEPRLKSVTPNTARAKAADTQEIGSMDLEKLKAEHPAVFAAAVKVGATQERDRVTAHLTMGEGSGDMATAIAAVKDGSEMTAALQAKYLTAGMNRAASAARAGDDKIAGAATAGAATAGEGTAADVGAQVADRVEEMLGLPKA